jgi:hypothetical protein
VGNDERIADMVAKKDTMCSRVTSTVLWKNAQNVELTCGFVLTLEVSVCLGKHNGVIDYIIN